MVGEYKPKDVHQKVLVSAPRKVSRLLSFWTHLRTNRWFELLSI